MNSSAILFCSLFLLRLLCTVVEVSFELFGVCERSFIFGVLLLIDGSKSCVLLIVFSFSSYGGFALSFISSGVDVLLHSLMTKSDVLDSRVCKLSSFLSVSFSINKLVLLLEPIRVPLLPSNVSLLACVDTIRKEGLVRSFMIACLKLTGDSFTLFAGFDSFFAVFRSRFRSLSRITWL